MIEKLSVLPVPLDLLPALWLGELLVLWVMFLQCLHKAGDELLTKVAE
jgi:hypothetical protein